MWGRGSWLALGAILAGSACGGPLDRRDGALIIRMTGVPPAVDRISLTLHAGGRDFPLALPRPPDDIIDALTAVPAGPGSLDLALLSGEATVARLQGYPVDIVELGVKEVITAFGDGPELQVALRTPGPQPVWSGPVLIDVRDQTPVPPAEVALEVWVDGAPHPAPPLMAGAAVLQLEPTALASALPRTFRVEVEGCFEGLPGACTTRTLEVEAHRRLWRTTGLARPAGAPLVLEAEGWLVVGDEQGRLHVLAIDTGEPVQAALTLGAELTGAAARVGAVVAIADRGGAVHGLAVGTAGLTPRWRRALSAPRPSPVVSDGARFVVGDQARLLALAPDDGAEAALATLSAPILAAPLADEAGVAAGDLEGRVVSLDRQDNLRFEEALGAAIYAAPARDGARLVVITGEGALHTLDAAGRPARAPVDLGAPVVFPPVPVATGWAVAAGRSVLFVEGDAVRAVPVGERVMGAPAPWPEGDGVVVGLFNGRVVVARPTGARTLGLLPGLALHPATLPGPPRAFVGGSVGEYQGLRAEEGF
jgi:hypothetical protein